MMKKQSTPDLNHQLNKNANKRPYMRQERKNLQLATIKTSYYQYYQNGATPRLF